jgi:hypothetical protein
MKHIKTYEQHLNEGIIFPHPDDFKGTLIEDGDDITFSDRIKDFNVDKITIIHFVLSMLDKYGYDKFVDSFNKVWSDYKFKPVKGETDKLSTLYNIAYALRKEDFPIVGQESKEGLSDKMVQLLEII